MKTKELIKALNEIDPMGTSEVYLSADSEGNHYGTTNKGSFAWDATQIIIYPYEEYVNVELQGTDPDTRQYDYEIREASKSEHNEDEEDR